MTRAVAVLLALGLAVVPVGAAGAAPPGTRPLFRLADTRIDEASGLADGGDVLFTVNDSGGGPVVYAVSKRTGRTVGRSIYADQDPTDVEAVAADAAGALWVGDIGDNRSSRDSVTVYRVPPATHGDRRVAARRYRLVYPGGPVDAETLLVRPGDDRLFVVSKSVFGGTVYMAPRPLREDGPNRLTPVARVRGWVTDGAFFPDGRHVVLRTYRGATVYAFPGFVRVGHVRLPRQRQGEAVTVGDHGQLYVGSEGVHSRVYRVPPPLPSPLPSGQTSAAGALPGPGRQRPTPLTPPRHRAASEAPGAGDWLVAGVLVGAGVAAAYVASWVLRAARRRGPRTR